MSCLAFVCCHVKFLHKYDLRIHIGHRENFRYSWTGQPLIMGPEPGPSGRMDPTEPRPGSSAELRPSSSAESSSGSKKVPKLNGQARTIVYNVYKFFEEEKHNRRSKYSFENVLKKTAEATGFSQRTVTRIRAQGLQAEASQSTRIRTPRRNKRCRSVCMDNFDLAALRQIIISIYTVRKEVPTLKKIFAAARNNLKYEGGLTTLRTIIINDLGFTFKKCKQKRSVLIEKPNIRAWRAKYLRAVRANDGLGAYKKPMIYLDETWIHAHYTVKKCWQNSTCKETMGILKNDSPGRRWVIVHAGGEKGFVKGAFLMFKAKTKTGDYHQEMNGENFKKWAAEKLIPNLTEPSIIVMDNASYHSMQSEKIPTMSTKKGEMQEWLRKNNIPFDDHMFKPELYTLIKRSAPQKKYEVDELFKRNGHKVFRLPPYNCDLNPIEQIWNIIKQKVSSRNVEQKEKEIERLTREAVESITTEDWVKEVNCIKRREEEYWERERMYDIQDIVVHVGKSDESDTSLDSDSDSESAIETMDCDDSD